MFGDMLESIWNLRNHWKQKEVLWKTRFISAGIFAKVLENIEYKKKQWKYSHIMNIPQINPPQIAGAPIL